MYDQYLIRLLAPLGLYDLRAPYNGGELAALGTGWGYFCMVALSRAVAASCFAIFALLVSTYIPNRFIVISVPMIAYYVGLNVHYWSGAPMLLNYASVFIVLPQNLPPLQTFLYVAASATLLSSVFTYLSGRRIKRRLRNA